MAPSVGLLALLVPTAAAMAPLSRPVAPWRARTAPVRMAAPEVDPWAPGIVLPVIGPILHEKLGPVGDVINWVLPLLLFRELLQLGKSASGALQYRTQGPGPAAVHYERLAGRPSWGAEAAASALAGRVPLTSEDGCEVATFAGGCFWGIELLFQRIPGVVATAAGYAQGELERPTYRAVCTGCTGHTEAVQIIFRPEEISYAALCEALLEHLGRSVYLKDQVGNDRGPQVRRAPRSHPDAPADRVNSGHCIDARAPTRAILVIDSG